MTAVHQDTLERLEADLLEWAGSRGLTPDDRSTGVVTLAAAEFLRLALEPDGTGPPVAVFEAVVLVVAVDIVEARVSGDGSEARYIYETTVALAGGPRITLPGKFAELGQHLQFRLALP